MKLKQRKRNPILSNHDTCPKCGKKHTLLVRWDPTKRKSVAICTSCFHIAYGNSFWSAAWAWSEGKEELSHDVSGDDQ